jgi:hypothetical protein
MAIENAWLIGTLVLRHGDSNFMISMYYYYSQVIWFGVFLGMAIASISISSDSGKQIADMTRVERGGGFSGP